MQTFLLLLANAFSMLLPLLFSGLALILVIRKRVFESLNVPIDFGLLFGGKPLIGKSKTVRGLIVHVVVATLVAVLLNRLAQVTFLVAPLYLSNPWVLGPVVSLAYVLGEVVNSFVKRRLGVEPGRTLASGVGRLVQKFFDNADGMLVVGLVMIFGYQLPGDLLAVCFVLSVLAHELTDVLMRALGLKKHQ